jgi:Protein of unknown function (DUF3037)
VAALQQLEFFLLRYTGNATKGESINLGVVAIEPERPGGFADVRFMRDWRRLQCFDPLADSDELQASEREIRKDLQDPQKQADLLKRLSDSWSNTIRFDQIQGCLTESPALEMERLSAIYLETPRPASKGEPTGRQRILNVMRDEFQRAGVLSLMLRDISASEFTKAGDPLKLDFGYPCADGFKFLQAVSLAQRVESATMLAARFPQIAAGMLAKKNVKAWLTAIVDDDLSKREEVEFALDMMRESDIVVAHAAEMSRIVEGIRVELRA